MLLVGLETTKIVPTKPWHTQAVSDSAREICRARIVAVNSYATCYSLFGTAVGSPSVAVHISYCSDDLLTHRFFFFKDEPKLSSHMRKACSWNT